MPAKINKIVEFRELVAKQKIQLLEEYETINDKTMIRFRCGGCSKEQQKSYKCFARYLGSLCCACFRDSVH